MQMKDQCGILDKIIQLAKQENDQEHGALIVGEVLEEGDQKIYCLTDGCMVKDLGGEEQEDRVKIPANLT